MADILNITDKPIFDDFKIETHTDYNPYANTTFRRRDMDTYKAAGFVHVAVRQFFLHRRKIDGEEKE